MPSFKTLCFSFCCQVRDQFGARVIFPQKSSDDDAELVTIIGRKEKADAAKEHLLKLIKDLVCVCMCVGEEGEGGGGGGVGGERIR